jgi:hypothetical protein
MVLEPPPVPENPVDNLEDIRRVLSSVHICAYTVPKIAQFLRTSEERTQLIVDMLVEYGYIRRVDEFLWLTNKGEEWRKFLNNQTQ